MEKLVITGPTPLRGEVKISGAKNAAVGIIPATLLINGICTIENLPNISDVKSYCEILETLGVKITWINRHTVQIDSRNLTSTVAPLEMTRKFRASYYLLGALLGRMGHAEIGMPGGCNLGPRPIDQHIKGFEALGATVDVSGGSIEAKCDGLKAANIYMDIVSVGATMNVMLAAVLAEGTTTIDNAAKEPHIVDLANFLNTMGADIRGAGTDVIRVNGVKELKGDAVYSIVPDQIMGGNVDANGDHVRVWWDKKTNGVNIKTLPYPGYPTDLQSQIGVCLAMSAGTSIINESIWDSRFQYTQELNKMGAKITTSGKTAVFEGVDFLYGAPVAATDLRAGAALIIAGIAANGVTEVFNIEHIDRGYENIEEKFRKLGANIERVSYTPDEAFN